MQELTIFGMWGDECTSVPRWQRQLPSIYVYKLYSTSILKQLSGSDLSEDGSLTQLTETLLNSADSIELTLIPVNFSVKEYQG